MLQDEQPQPDTPEQAVANSTGPRGTCPVCQCEIAHEDEYGDCPACSTSYHVECWEDNGGCAVYGCEHVPETDGLRAVEIPASYWGQERKSCPNCNKDIQAAAIRCRYCSARFPSAEPMHKMDYNDHLRQKVRLPGRKAITSTIFALCLVPGITIIGLIAAGIWYPISRKDLNVMPSVYSALLKIGIGVSVLQILLYLGIAVIGVFAID